MSKEKMRMIIDGVGVDWTGQRAMKRYPFFGAFTAAQHPFTYILVSQCPADLWMHHINHS
jgi:hypothetical protein